MSRLIDADALEQAYDDKYTLGDCGRRERDDVVYALRDAPTVEPASPWHRVEEPPKDSKPVICWEKQGFPYVDRYFPKYGWEFANNALAEPIYWMPIEPPKEGT